MKTYLRIKLLPLLFLILATTTSSNAENKFGRLTVQSKVSSNCSSYLSFKKSGDRLQKQVTPILKKRPSNFVRCTIKIEGRISKLDNKKERSLSSISSSKSFKCWVSSNGYIPDRDDSPAHECMDHTVSILSPAVTKKSNIEIEVGSLEKMPGVEDPAPSKCEAYITEIFEEARQARSCNSDADCGATLPLTGCGATRNICANRHANTSYFKTLTSAALKENCDVPYQIVSACDVPQATARCIKSQCTWEYVNSDGSTFLDPR